MSDPMNRPVNPPPVSDPPPRKSANPLIWILLLIALAAFGWYFYNQRGAVTPPADTTPPPATTDAMTPEPAASAEREPARRAAVARPVRPAKPARIADRDPQPIARSQPEYPAAAFRAGEEGTVLIRADVDARGNAGNVDIAKRSGSRDLDRAAVDAVRKWRFEPAMKNGKAVASTVEVPVDFTLDEQ